MPKYLYLGNKEALIEKLVNILDKDKVLQIKQYTYVYLNSDKGGNLWYVFKSQEKDDKLILKGKIKRNPGKLEKTEFLDTIINLISFILLLWLLLILWLCSLLSKNKKNDKIINENYLDDLMVNKIHCVKYRKIDN